MRKKRGWKRGEWEGWDPGEKIESHALYFSGDNSSFIGLESYYSFFCPIVVNVEEI